MAGQKLTLEITAKGVTQTVGEIKTLKTAVEELDRATASTADNFASGISQAVAQAASEIEDLITLIQGVPTIPTVSAPLTPNSQPLSPQPLTPEPQPQTSAPVPSPSTPQPSAQPVIDTKQYEADLDAIALAEKKRLIEIQNLLNEEAISEDEANERRVESRKKAIAEQIEAEKRKLAQLEALPPFLTPEAEENRQKQIRASLQRTADLQLNLAETSSGAFSAAKPPTNLLKGVADIAFGFNNALAAIQTFVAGGQQAYELLIGANERLNQQVLASAASISANADVFQGGVKIEDPTEAIKAIQPKIQAAIKQLEKDTQSLVGVTSADTTEVFNTLLTNFGELQGQSKTINDSIDAGRVLTKSFVATLGSLQIPLDQASQEISSILTGEITDDSLLAKRIGLKSAEIQQYKEQGVLVDKLVERMSAFTSANALASNSIGGITSNLQDVLELTLRTAGAPLLDALVAQLQNLYKFIQANQDDFQNAATGAVNFVLVVFNQLVEVLGAIGNAIAPLGKALGDAFKQNIGDGVGGATAAVELLANALVALINTAAPLVQVLASVVSFLSGALNTEFGKFILLTAGITTALVQASAVIGTVVTAISGLGAAVAAGAAAMTAAIPAIAAFGAATAAALAPMVALGAAIATVVIAKKAFDLSQVNKSIDDFSTTVGKAGDDSSKLADQLKSLNKAQKANGQLTAEQQAQREKLASAAKAQIDQNNALIASLKSVTPASEEQKNALFGLEQQLTISNRALQGQIDGNSELGNSASKNAKDIKIQTKALSDQGGAYDQIAKKVSGAIDKINKDGGGKLEVAEEAAKQLTELTQQQLDAGKITTDTAIEQLELVAKNTKLSAETQLAAQEALTKIREQEGQKQVDAITAREDEINKKVAEGKLSQESGERELTKVKIAELQKRLELNKQALAAEQAAGRGNGAKAQELLKEQKSLSTELAQAQAKTEDEANAARLKDFEERQTVLQSQLDAQKISQEKFAEESAKIQTGKIDEELKQLKAKRSQLAATDKEGLEALNAQEAKLLGERAKIVQQEQERIRQLRLEDIDEQKALLERQFAEGTITEEEYSKRSLANAVARFDEELKQNQEKRAQLAKGDKEGLERLTAEENKIRAERAKAIEDAQQKELERRKRLLEDELDKSLDTVKRAETERLIETQKLLNAGFLSEEDAAKQRLDLQQQSLEQELSVAKRRAAELQSQKLSDPEAERERQAEIRTALQSTADLQLKLLELEAQKQEQVRAAAKQAIDDRVAAQERATQATVLGFQEQEAAIDRSTRGLQAQLTAQEAIARSLDAQQKLIEARAGLADASRNLEIQGLEFQQQNLQRATELQKELSSGQIKDANLRKTIEAELAKLGVEGAADSLSIARQQAALADQIAAKQIAAKQAELGRTKALQDIELKRNELAAKRAVIEAKIAENQAKQKVLQAQQQQVEAQQQVSEAQAEIERAQLIEDPGERQRAVAKAQSQLAAAQFAASQSSEGVAIAQEDASLQSENLKAAQENVAAQAELAAIAQKTLEAQQASATAQLQQAEAARVSAQNIALARAEAEAQEQKTKGTAQNLQEAASASQKISGNGGSSVGQRFKGGPMEANQPYWVGEDPATGKILPTSEIVVPNTQSYTVAAVKAQQWLKTAVAPTASPLRYAVPSITPPAPVESPTSRQLLGEIGHLRNAIADLSARPPGVKNEFHNTFARADEQAFMDKIRRQTADSIGGWIKAASDRANRGY